MHYPLYEFNLLPSYLHLLFTSLIINTLVSKIELKASFTVYRDLPNGGYGMK